MAVLDGELAVPCNLQSAIAGFNSHPEVCSTSDYFQQAMLIVQVLRNR